MILKLRVILETEEDVFRDIEVQDTQNLLEIHQGIKDAFQLDGEEMASFYLSNDEWFQGSEIPMEDFSEEGNTETMGNIAVNQVIPSKGNKMIYVYDFFELWTFYVEVVEEDVISVNNNFPAVVFEYGQRPDNAPENDMLGEIDLYVDIEDDEDDFLDFDENGYNDQEYW